MARTTADVPPVEAATYNRIIRPSAVASADGDGYTKTRPMMQVQQPPGSSQFGLPRSGKGVKSPTMKAPKKAL